MKSVFTVVLSLFMFCCLTFSVSATENTDRFKGKNVVIVLSSGDDIVAGAGLVMAKMAAGSGADVTVYVATDAVKYAVQNSFHRFAPKKTTHREMLETVINKGGKPTVSICKTVTTAEKSSH